MKAFVPARLRPIGARSPPRPATPRNHPGGRTVGSNCDDDARVSFDQLDQGFEVMDKKLNGVIKPLIVF